MANSFFLSLDNIESPEIKQFAECIHSFSNSTISDDKQKQIYIISRPLADDKYSYQYDKAVVILSPDHKLMFIDFNEEVDSDKFYDYYEDFLEDLGSISDKYEHKNKIGRPRVWKDRIIETINYNTIKEQSIEELFESNKIPLADKRLVEIVISLLVGSINDIEKIQGTNLPDTLLDKVKQKIILFDGTQTNFLYQNKLQKIITIQGLSGTGKTELLLHKLIKLYVNDPESKIMFTCYNKVLADDLKKRIPEFFNFMKVEKQIEWEERLWCVSSWGATHNPNSGAYRYICSYYNIPFYTYSRFNTFEAFCKQALEQIEQQDEKENYAFDYMLIDESQDFGEEFFKLCERVTRKQIYIAGDIFQDIFGSHSDKKFEPDYLLNQCYRTDPKTLMFSHALSMGLFEDKKLQWLTDDQWTACGYNIVDRTDNYYKLTRDPIRRFEDLTSEERCLQIINIEVGDQKINICQSIVDEIKNIREKNPTVIAEDIGIICMVTSREYNSNLASLLSIELEKNDISWELNRAFETKKRPAQTLFFSNHNNVKGLEFPFVICISPYELDNSLNKRNALYMALTRSFIQTSLLIPNINPSILEGLNNILTQKCIFTTKPSDEEQTQIKQLNLQFRDTAISHKDLVFSLMEELKLNIHNDVKVKIYAELFSFVGETYDVELLKKTIELAVEAGKTKI